MPGSLRCTASGLSIFVEAVSGLVEIPTSPHLGCFVTKRSGRLRPFFEQAISFNDAKDVAADRKVTLEYITCRCMRKPSAYRDELGCFDLLRALHPPKNLSADF